MSKIALLTVPGRNLSMISSLSIRAKNKTPFFKSYTLQKYELTLKHKQTSHMWKQIFFFTNVLFTRLLPKSFLRLVKYLLLMFRERVIIYKLLIFVYILSVKLLFWLVQYHVIDELIGYSEKCHYLFFRWNSKSWKCSWLSHSGSRWCILNQ